MSDERFYSTDGERWQSLKSLILHDELGAGDKVMAGTGRRPKGADLVKFIYSLGESILYNIADNNDEWFLDDWGEGVSVEAEEELVDFVAGWLDRHAPVEQSTVTADGEYVITEADALAAKATS